MAFAIAQPIMIQRAKFTSNATVIAHLLIFDFRGLEATNAPQGTLVPTGDSGQFKVVHRTNSRATCDLKKVTFPRPDEPTRMARSRCVSVSLVARTGIAFRCFHGLREPPHGARI
jgi:hypothetical protein